METSAAFPLDGSLLCLAVVLKVETKMFFSLLLLFTLSIYKKGEEYKRKHGNDPAGDPIPRIIIATLHCSVCVIYSRREDNVTPAYIRKLLLHYWDGRMECTHLLLVML
jgi:hypothetical protein